MSAMRRQVNRTWIVVENYQSDTRSIVAVIQGRRASLGSYLTQMAIESLTLVY